MSDYFDKKLGKIFPLEGEDTGAEPTEAELKNYQKQRAFDVFKLNQFFASQGWKSKHAHIVMIVWMAYDFENFSEDKDYRGATRATKDILDALKALFKRAIKERMWEAPED